MLTLLAHGIKELCIGFYNRISCYILILMPLASITLVEYAFSEGGLHAGAKPKEVHNVTDWPDAHSGSCK